jgi:mannobiose 2-epimerase
MLQMILKRVKRLNGELIRFWIKNGPDPDNGGFYGKHYWTGKPDSKANKGLIQQARHLWTFSMLYYHKERSEKFKRIADNLYNFIITSFWDKNDNEFYYMVNANGKVVSKKKQFYAISFAIYSLAQYAQAFGHREAIELALNCADSICKRGHDPRYGGFDQRNDPGWLKPSSSKELNTHLHLLESFALLYKVTRNKNIGKFLAGLYEVFLNNIIDSRSYCHPEFKQNWSPVYEPTVSYGHDLEAVWLLYEAAKALGRDGEPGLLKKLKVVGQHSSEQGFDPENGGYFYIGVAGIGPVDKRKVWWVQAEALAGLWCLYRLTRDKVHLKRLEKTLDWIEQYQRDAERGEWYGYVTSQGQPCNKEEPKGHEWKCSYHNIRALTFLEKWIIAERNGAGY